MQMLNKHKNMNIGSECELIAGNGGGGGVFEKG